MDKTFDEYPPGKYLSKVEQDSLLSSFIITRNHFDVKSISEDREKLEAVRSWHKLKYYEKKGDTAYFMVSFRGYLLGNGIACYGGRVIDKDSKRSFEIVFEQEVSLDFQTDSVKRKFKRMLCR